MNYKDTEPYKSAFLKNWPVNGICGIVFNRFYRLEIHSLISWNFRPSLWTVAAMEEGTILVYCCPSIFSLTSLTRKLKAVKELYLGWKLPVHAITVLCTLNVFDYEISLSCEKVRKHHREPLFGHGNTFGRGLPVILRYRQCVCLGGGGWIVL